MYTAVQYAVTYDYTAGYTILTLLLYMFFNRCKFHNIFILILLYAHTAAGTHGWPLGSVPTCTFLQDLAISAKH